jgi:hypothetical protein
MLDGSIFVKIAQRALLTAVNVNKRSELSVGVSQFWFTLNQDHFDSLL